MARERGYRCDVSGHVASFPGHEGGARKLPENKAAAVKNIAELVASFPGHVGGSRKWNGKEATAMNWQSRL